ncbi:MAG: hypothetical protein ACJA1O_001439 [Spirosomataceae bacterium]|jgi:hypothetical protein
MGSLIVNVIIAKSIFGADGNRTPASAAAPSLPLNGKGAKSKSKIYYLIK